MIRRKTLPTTLLVLALSGPLAVVSTTAMAGNFHSSWSRTRTGPNGGSVTHSGSCNSGAGCSRSTTATGPNGRTYTAQHSAQANGQGGLDRSSTYSGPNGSVTRSVDTYRYPY